MMDLFDLADDATNNRIQPIPLVVETLKNPTNFEIRDPLFRCSSGNSLKWKHCIKTYRKFYPILFGIDTDCSGDILRTGNWLRGSNAMGGYRKHPQEPCEKKQYYTTMTTQPTTSQHRLCFATHSVGGYREAQFFWLSRRLFRWTGTPIVSLSSIFAISLVWPCTSLSVGAPSS
jgi:hypothetical protein